MTILLSKRKTTATLLATLMLSACGGGGGSGSGGPPPPPPPAADTYTLQLTDANLEDTRNNTVVDASGLPVTGSTATRN